MLDFTLNISTTTGSVTTATVLPGGTASYSFTVSPTGSATFPTEVKLTASGLPAGATYTLTPSEIAAGTGATTVTLSIELPQQTAASQHPGMKFGLKSAPFALALLLLPLAGRIRRAGKRIGRGMTILLLLLTGLGATSFIGCSSGAGFFGQQQKTYTVTVTGTSGALVHFTTVTLNVE